MIRFFLLACFLSTAAAANPHDDGGEYAPPIWSHSPRHVESGEYITPSEDGFGEYIIRTTPSEEHLADVFFQNRLVSRVNVPEEFLFEIEGHVLHVIIDSGDGNAPDLITVIPPDGYYAFPADALVPENESVVIEIREFLFM